jgi:hypothetical protein
MGFIGSFRGTPQGIYKVYAIYYTMKIKELKEVALKELEEENRAVVVGKIKSFEKRISTMEKALKELRGKYDGFLNSNVEDIEFDEFDY